MREIRVSQVVDGRSVSVQEGQQLVVRYLNGQVLCKLIVQGGEINLALSNFVKKTECINGVEVLTS